MQSSSISLVAPKNKATCFMKITPKIEMIIPPITTALINIVKHSFALCFLPWPSNLETKAVPPVPNIKPSPAVIIINGITKLIAAKAVLPAKLEIKKPSTTP